MIIFKKIRKYYWIVQEFTKRHHKTISTAAILSLIIFSILKLAIRYIPSPKTVTKIGKIGKYSPTEIPENIKRKLSEGLVTISEEGQFKPALASDWTISDNGKTYTFTLNENKVWHNDTKLKPEDLNLNFREVKKEIQDNKIIFHLQEPFSPFLAVVSKPILKQNKYGTGNYHLKKITAPKGVIQKLTIESSKKKLIYKFYPTENTAITAFKAGEIDQIQNLSYIPEDLKNEKNTIIENSQGEEKITALFFNNNDNLLSNKFIRQALAYAIKDKSFGKERAISPITKDSWVYNPNVKDYAFDPTKAKKLLRGETEGLSEIKLEIKTTLRYLEEAEQIAKDWQQNLDIKTSVKVTTNPQSDFQVLLVDFTPPFDPDQYTIWHSTQNTNLTNYQNLKVDKLLEDGRKTLDKQARQEIYYDFQRFLLEDLPALFLFYSKNYNLKRKSLI